MYTTYFGLSEAPFSIAPDPAYLFMSERHREALAHLSYGLGDNGGFVLLTGEVGTGKTTISRSVMEKLPDNTQAAFILNPTLSCDELLATICDNLQIRYKKTGATLKYLTDKIQEKLIKNHQSNINTLLIIDEAQHLQPQVLEQLRLLTNLETNTKKLLQVILIGQPELQQLLQRRDLRQLAQRITARYHLLPLTKQELVQYIQHRLSVAQCTRALFNNAAIAELHKISQGIPRVINLLCDRALIIAYSKNVSLVNRNIIRQAATQALGDDVDIKSFWQQPLVSASIIAAVITLSIAGGYWFGFHENTTSNKDNLATTPTLNTSLVEQKEPLIAPVKAAAPKEVFQSLTLSDSIESKPVPRSLNETSEKVTEQEVEQPRILGYQPERVISQGKDGAITIRPEDGVPDELLARFQAAVKATTEQSVRDNDELTTSEMNTQDIPLQAIHQMPAEIQDSLPKLQFDMHIYATEGQGWVRVNGEQRREGEQIARGVILAQILPQHVVLEFRDERFTMPALSSW